MTTRTATVLLILALSCAHTHAKWWWEKEKDDHTTSASKQELSKTTVTNGMSEAELIATIGEPKGEFSGGAKKTLMYDGVQIQLINGRVANLPANISTELEAGKKERQLRDKEKAKKEKKGLVFYDGEWIKESEKKKRQTAKLTPTQSQKSTTKSTRGRYVMRGKIGEPIHHNQYIYRGKVTVVDFYADWCGPCKKLAPDLDKLLRNHPDVALRKVNIGTWGSRVAVDYNVTSVPNVRVFDREGNMMAPPTSNLQKIDLYIKRAKKK